MTEKGWAVVFDMPSFDAARNKMNQAMRFGALEWLNPTLPSAYKQAAEQVYDDDTYKPRVFWVVRET